MHTETPDNGLIDEMLEASFPASDPPSLTPVTKAGAPRRERDLPGGGKKIQQDEAAEPKGSPTSDRHRTETAHQRESEVLPDGEATSQSTNQAGP